MSMTAPIAALYASLLGVLLIALAFKVVQYRRTLRIGVGDGGNKDLERAIRVHANAAEHIPAALLLLLVYELNGGAPAMLHACGGVLFLARVMHAYGLGKSAGTSFGRFWGVVGTWVVMLTLAVANIVKLFPL
jgi:hypothetical protein